MVECEAWRDASCSEKVNMFGDENGEVQRSVRPELPLTVSRNVGNGLGDYLGEGHGAEVRRCHFDGTRMPLMRVREAPNRL